MKRTAKTSKKQEAKRRASKPVRSGAIRVCPACGSSAIEYASMVKESGSAITGFGLPEQYFCKNCTYAGSVVLEIDKNKLSRLSFPYVKTKTRSTLFRHDLQPRTAWLYKPIFLIVIVLFLTLTIALLTPTQVNQVAQEQYFTFQGHNATITVSGQPIVVLPVKNTISVPLTTGGYAVISTQPITPKETSVYIAVYNQTITSALHKATGLDNTTGFLVDLFFLFLAIGILVAMAASYALHV